MSREIPLTKGLRAIVDDADYESLSACRWRVSGSRYPYACRAGGANGVLMHRQLMDPPEGLVVDHINGNTLDNRRSNLRICTRAQNVANRHGPSKAKSGYFGVYRRLRGGFAARIAVNNVIHQLGTFPDAIGAALAHDAAALRLRGPHGPLNFPTSERGVA